MIKTLCSRIGLVALTMALSVNAAFAAGVQLGPGASINLGGGALDLGCGDLQLQGSLTLAGASISQAGAVILAGGTLNTDNGALEFTGDWQNAGTFSAGNGVVSNVDGCAQTTSAFSGDSVFANFSALTGSGKALVFQVGSTTEFTNDLQLIGDPASRLVIRSSVPGATANFILRPGAGQTVSGIDVQDIDARGGERIGLGTAADLQSVNSGNALNWFTRLASGIAVPIPGLTSTGKLSLALLFLLIGGLVFRATARTR